MVNKVISMNEFTTTEAFSGIVEIEGKQVSYTFEDFVIIIEDSSFFAYDGWKTPWKSLRGYVSNKPNMVYFSLGSIRRKSVNVGGFSSFPIYISVQYYVILNREYDDNHVMLKYKNKDFAKWLSLYPVYSISQDNQSFVINSKLTKKLDSLTSNVEVSNKHYKFIPTVDAHYSPTYFDYTPSLTIECLDKVEFDDLYSLTTIVLQLIQYCFLRLFVDLGDIEILCKNSEQDRFVTTGSLHINYRRHAIEYIDLNSITDFGFIPWRLINGVLQTLIKSLENKELYLNNLYERKDDRYVITFSTISSDSAAFEYEFGKRFKEYKTIKLKDQVYIGLKKKIESIRLNKQEKGILKDCVSRFFDYPSLREKAESAINQYYDIIEKCQYFKTLTNKSSKAIANAFIEGRNLVDHGSKNLVISQDIIKSFFIIRVVIICMQLERLGMERDNIKSSLSFLFDCRFF